MSFGSASSIEVERKKHAPDDSTLRERGTKIAESQHKLQTGSMMSNDVLRRFGETNSLWSSQPEIKNVTPLRPSVRSYRLEAIAIKLEAIAINITQKKIVFLFLSS